MKRILFVGVVTLVVIAGVAGYLTETRTNQPHTAFSSSTCTNTGGIGCPHFINQTWAVSVDYGGNWKMAYQTYLGVEAASRRLIESGSFAGSNSSNHTFKVSGIDPEGATLCVTAQKLDSSTSTLRVDVVGTTVVNETSLPFGTVRFCIASLIT